MFQRARITKAEFTRDGSNKIIKIYLNLDIQDDSIVEPKAIDFVIDGGTLDEIRSNLKDGVMNLVKENVKQKYQEWMQEVGNIEQKSDLTPAQIISQFGSDEITQLP